MKCQVEGCKELTKWNLYKTYPTGEKKWIHVCDEHEREIGEENIRLLFGHPVYGRKYSGNR